MNVQEMILNELKELKMELKCNSNELQLLKIEVNTLKNKSNFTIKGLMVVVGIVSTVVSGLTVVVVQKMI